MISLFQRRPLLAALPLALLLCWAPLPFASVTPVGLLVLRAGSFMALALALVTCREPETLRRAAMPAVALALLALLGIAQAAPLPRSCVALISPQHLHLVEQARELTGAGTSPGIALSLAPSQSLSTALSFLALAAALLAAALVGVDRQRRRWLLAALLAAATFQLLYGFQHLAAGSLTVWGLEVGRSPERLRGTFVNSAHLALYLEMVLAVVFALTWWVLRSLRRARGPLELRVALGATPVLGWLLVFLALAFTRSRAGLVAAAVATLAQGAFLAAHRRRWRLLPIGLLAVILGVSLVAGVGVERGLGRLLGTSTYSITTGARLQVWGGTFELWRRFPWTGTGLGTFEAAFPMVEAAELTTVSWQHAHNDWLEILVTGGVVGAVMILFGVAALLGRLGQVLLTSRRSETRAAALAALGAWTAVALHELVDFGLTLPANAFTLAVLSGAAIAAHRDERGPIRAG